MNTPSGQVGMQLVERRAATKSEGIAQKGMREYIDDGPADDEILFDLRLANPRRFGAPLKNVPARYHDSASILTLMWSFQGLSRRDGARGAFGERAVQSRACSRT